MLINLNTRCPLTTVLLKRGITRSDYHAKVKPLTRMQLLTLIK